VGLFRPQSHGELSISQPLFPRWLPQIHAVMSQI
jgi:hypothetical protein